MFGRVKRDWENWWVQWPMLYNFNDVDDRSFPWWFRIWPLLLQGGGFKHCFDNVNFTHTLRKGFNLTQGKLTDSEQRTFHRDCRLRFTLPYLCHTMPSRGGAAGAAVVLTPAAADAYLLRQGRQRRAFFAATPQPEEKSVMFANLDKMVEWNDPLKGVFPSRSKWPRS